jgi:hypothetical protein
VRNEQRDDRGEFNKRLERLVDSKLYQSDAFYHSQVSTFRTWLIVTELAMKDEDIDPSVAERVLNRVVYGTPSGADAHLRIERDAELLEQFRKMPPLPISIEDLLKSPSRAGRKS